IERNAGIDAEKLFKWEVIKSEEMFFAFLVIAIVIKCILCSVVTEPILFYVATYDNSFGTIVNILHAIIIEITVQDITDKWLAVYCCCNSVPKVCFYNVVGT